MKKKDVVEETIKVYEKHSGAYAEHYMRVKSRDMQELFIKKLKGKRILDVGCGPGSDAKYFSDRGFEVTGIDLTKNFIKMASKNAPKASFIVMDMRKLDFADKSFDGIWANVSFLHLPKSEGKGVLLEFARVLKQGGLLYLSVKTGEGEKFVTERTKDRRFFSFYNADEIKEAIKSCGFNVSDVIFKKSEYSENRKFINIFAIKP